MKSLLISIILFLPALFSCQHPDVLTREEVIAVIKRFDDGWKNKNASLVDSVLSPSYIYFTASGGVFSREGVVQTAGATEYTLSKVERMEYTVQIDGNTAIVNSIWKGTGIYRGDPFDDNQRCSLTIMKTNGLVQIFSEHCTPIK